MSALLFTREQFVEAFPRASADAIDAWIGPLNTAMAQNGIDTPARMAGFLSSVANETGQLTQFYEQGYYNTPYERVLDTFGASAPSRAQFAEWRRDRSTFDIKFFNWVYDDANRPAGYKLGNDRPGDGYKYRGIGPGQITGKGNARALFKRMGLPLDTDPAVFVDPVHGSAAFASFWKFAGNNERMDRGAFVEAMRVMNAGLKDFSPHQVHYARISRVLSKTVKPQPVTKMEAAGQVATSKIGIGAAIGAGGTAITLTDQVVKATQVATEAKTGVDAATGLFGALGLPAHYVAIAIGVVALAAIVFVAVRYGKKLLDNEAVST